MEIKFIIIDPLGLHARPASLVVNVALKFESEIKILANGKKGNLKSVMSLMAMAIKKNQEILVTIVGIDEKEALKAIEEVMKKNKLI